jgi:hypothetical protein
MATNLTTILTAIKTIMLTKLSASYKELTHIFQIERNHGREAKTAYAIRPLGAVENEETNALRNYTLDQEFEMILTDMLTRESDSTEAITSIEAMYDYFDQIYRVMVNTKLGLPSLVWIVRRCEISEPEFVSNGKIVVLRMKFNVKYRMSVP